MGQGGEDGLDVVRQIVNIVASVLKPTKAPKPRLDKIVCDRLESTQFDAAVVIPLNCKGDNF